MIKTYVIGIALAAVILALGIGAITKNQNSTTVGIIGQPVSIKGPTAKGITPVCLITLNIPGKRINGIMVWRVGTINPTAIERVCWHKGYKGP